MTLEVVINETKPKKSGDENNRRTVKNNNKRNGRALTINLFAGNWKQMGV